ncbi:alpha/beta hydrolase family protein [Parahaliea aestuarii]|uniref:S9 family peptidase n=1 Tax=Parahaliea aestuarii TaxID=1852021 RepID=A0A5C8ZPK4_9GAMM|nr:prolyl oligopeptidase family serine peptidase [Parahaliea aestuarii]TXS90413.1 S9 family peptidase [Parahaliea aestuarii]
MKQLLFVLLLSASFGFCSAGTLAQPITGEDLFKPNRISLPELSPGGKYLAAYLNEGDERGIFIVDVATGKYYPLLNFDRNNRLLGFTWVDEDTLYANYMVFERFFTQEIIDLTPSNLGKKSLGHRIQEPGYLLDPLRHQSDQILYVRTDEDGENEIVTASVSNMRIGKFTKETAFKHPHEGALRYSYDPDSSTYFSYHWDEEKETSSVWYLEHNQNTWKQLFSSADRDLHFKWLANLGNQQFAVLTNVASDRIAIYHYDARTGEFGQPLYLHDRYDLVDAEIDRSTGDVVSVSFFDHGRYSTKYLFSDSSRDLHLLQQAFPGKQILTLSVDKLSHQRVVGVFADDDPGTIYLFDPATRRAELIEYINPALVDTKLARTEVISVVAEDGIALEGFLTKPQSGNNGVLLVMPHGGPIGMRDYNDFNPEVQYFASRGYSVLRVNFRGSAGYGRTFADAGKTQFGELIERDIGTVVDAVRERFGYRQACAIGLSYGGYSSVMLTLADPDFYQCAVAMYGVYDLPLIFSASKFKASESFRKTMSEIMGDDLDELKARSPLYLAHRLERPILLIAGTEDEIADFEHSNRMKYTLQALGKEFEYHFYPGEGHGQSTYYGDQHQFALIDDFIRRKLGLDDFTSGTFSAIVADESLRLAQSFDDDGYYPDAQRAQYFYSKAARAGSFEAREKLGLDYSDATSEGEE